MEEQFEEEKDFSNLSFDQVLNLDLIGNRTQLYNACNLTQSAEQGPHVNLDNFMRTLRYYPPFKDLFWFDEFHQKFFVRGDEGSFREFHERDRYSLCAWFQRVVGMKKASDKEIYKAFYAVCFENIRNEPKDWMESLQWDGTARIHAFCRECLGVEDNEYSRAVSRNWMIAMAARIYRPGCKMDNMVVLEGPQGSFKSSALLALGSPWFTECHESVTTKDFYQTLPGQLIVEISELDAFSKAEVNTIKKVITRQVDRYRPSYGHTAQDFPRQSIFVGSTNDETYLKDATGARRFWPLRVGLINLIKIREWKEQLFAEAVAELKRGASWHQVPEKETLEEQLKRQFVDAWTDKVMEHVSPYEKVKIWEIATRALGLEIRDFDPRKQQRVGAILQRHGWRSKLLRNGVSVERWWVSPDFLAEYEERTAIQQDLVDYDVTKKVE